ncbi:MAG: substrate-binding domain-containing protein [Alphaproteobacteria bacterium]|nr:substrate-binding domain-containing protein [Alphaproteobacteria bacterium]
MRLNLAAALLVLLSFNSAWAADITVYAPNIVAGPLKLLAAEWTAKTGNKVTFAGFNVGRVRTAVENNDPGDVVVAPTGNFTDFASKLVAGSVRPLGRIPFAVVVKAGGAHPDISTHDKFVAFAKKAGVLAYADPKVGSLTGAMVEEMLKRPEFTGVEPRPIKGMIGEAIVRGDAEFGGGALTEELMAKYAEVVGPFPDDLGLHVDLSAAVLKISAAPSEAESFVRYVTRAGAAPVWKAGGVIEIPKK